MTNGFTLLAGWKIPHITVELLDDVVINTLHKTTVIFTFGVPGCGKSYWAKKYVAQYKDFVIVERDMCRHSIQNSQGIPTIDKAVVWPKWSFKTESDKSDPVGTIQKELITKAIAEGKNIIISDTNISTKTVNNLVEFILSLSKDVLFVAKIFDTPLQKCIKQNMQRPYPVSQRVIYDMWQRLQRLKIAVDAFFIKNQVMQNIPLDKLTNKSVIVDVDGTVANHVGVRSPFEWNKVHLDKPIETVISIVKSLKANGWNVIIMSGRDGVCENLTKQWLQDVAQISYDGFYMRKPDDMRSDSIVKYELYQQAIIDGFTSIRLCIDDRPRVCNLWRSLGLEVLQCGDPNIDF